MKNKIVKGFKIWYNNVWKGGFKVYIGYVLESAIQHLADTIDLLLEIGKGFDYMGKYTDDYFRIICLLMCLHGKVLRREWFIQVNDWICHFCNLSEADLRRKNDFIYRSVMDFTTDFCWNIGYCGKSEIYVRTENEKGFE